MTTKYGLFSEPTYLSPTSLSSKQAKQREAPDERAKPGFRAGCADKTGELQDATFAAYLPLHAGDKYEDASARLAAKRAAAPLAQKLWAVKQNGRVFKPASPCKRSTAPQAGEEYGTISAHYPHIPDPASSGEKRPEPSLQPKPIYTSPHKLGTYGFNLTTLSERQGAKGVAGEYEYVPDPFQQPRPRPAGKGVASAPFRLPARPLGSTFAQYEHIPQGAPVIQEEKRRPAFRPPRSGGNEPLNPPAEYIPSPYNGSKAKGLAAEKARLGAFKPTFSFRTTATPSILKMNIH